MTSTMCIFQKSMPLFAVLVTFFVLVANISGYGILSAFVTSLFMIISLSHIAFTPKKQIRVEEIKFCDENQDSSPLDDHQVLKTVQQEVLPVAGKECVTVCQDSSHLVDQVLERVQEEEEVLPVDGEEEQCVTVCQDSSHLDDQVCRTVQEVLPLYNADDQCVTVCQADDLYSESESIDPSFSSEDSDIDWRYSCIFGQSPECSDDSISDEESLIEIAIPSGHYLCPKESNFQKNHSNSTEAFLAKMNEMNEEDNLIEIDLSMGSIKCSRFEIEA